MLIESPSQSIHSKLSTTLPCSHCGFLNLAGAKFCSNCGTTLSITGQPQVPTSPSFGSVPSFQSVPSYDYGTIMEMQQRTHDIDRTKAGLMLLVIGIILGPIPYVKFVGGILVLIGAILVIIGRKSFGPDHSRNTIWSAIVFVVGLVVVIAGTVAFAFSVASAAVAAANRSGTFNPTIFSQSLSSAFTGILIGAAVGGAVIGIAQVLFTYAIQDHNGRTLLWAGYAASIAVSIATFFIITPLIADAASRSFNGTVYNPAAFADLQVQEQVLGLLGFVPAGLYATAIYMVWSRVSRGEIPSSSTPRGF